VAIGCFASAGITSWLAQRVATNERLARQRGRELATQMRVNQLVIQDMHDGWWCSTARAAWCSSTRRRSACCAPKGCSARRWRGLVPGFDGHWLAWRAGEESEASFDVELPGARCGCGCSTRGTEEGFAVCFIDDTTRTREQAQQFKLAALGRLTANIAHEIRNPLAAISHAAELLNEEKRAEDRTRLTRIINDNTQRLERLVADVMQLNRRDRMSAEPIALRPWLGAFIEEFVANESVEASRFAVDALGEPTVRFDRGHLSQVMWNLLRNAVRYAPGKPASVRIVLREFAGRVEISVLDDGPGCRRRSRGSSSSPSSLPRRRAPASACTSPASSAPRTAPRSSTSTTLPARTFRILCREARHVRRAERAAADAPRVLVVDDEPDIRELLELTLVKMGLGVVAVGSIAEAKDRLKASATTSASPTCAWATAKGLELVRHIGAAASTCRWR
jgi:two-component system sensor histidine kinase PilS (NtrC family)